MVVLSVYICPYPLSPSDLHFGTKHNWLLDVRLTIQQEILQLIGECFDFVRIYKIETLYVLLMLLCKCIYMNFLSLTTTLCPTVFHCEFYEFEGK